MSRDPDAPCSGIGCCPAGHELQPWVARSGHCDGCTRQVQRGENVMDCRRCNWYLCRACCPQDTAQSRTLWGQISSLPFYAVDAALEDMFGLASTVAQCAESKQIPEPEMVFSLCYEDSEDLEEVDARDPTESFGDSDGATTYRDHELEELMKKLFEVQDVDQNGTLEERELVQLNKKIALAHYGEGADLVAVQKRFQELYRTKLATEGQPGFYRAFRRYVLEVLEELDPDVRAQRPILEQLIAEATMGRELILDPRFRTASDESLVASLIARVAADGSQPAQTWRPVPQPPKARPVLPKIPMAARAVSKGIS